METTNVGHISFLVKVEETMWIEDPESFSKCSTRLLIDTLSISSRM